MAIRTCALAAAVVLGLLAAGCQPVDRLDLDEEPSPEPVPAGAGANGLPASLPEILDHGQVLAREWQREPVVAEVTVSLDGEEWRRARLLYIAADADRFLSLRFDGGQVTQERVTLETLGLQVVPATAIAAVPPFPADALEPLPLAEAAGPHLEGCLAGAPSEVIYDTGAPAAWDGQAWTDPPMWTATLWHTSSDGSGQGRRVDPISGAPVDELCATVGP